MTERALTPTSYVVLGLVRALQPCTSYEMKQLVSTSIGMFWSFPHSQLYAEPARLVEDGMLEEQQEDSGRRRRQFRITSAGREALHDWLTDTTTFQQGELRDDGLLRLFFSNGLLSEEIVALAQARRQIHEDRVGYLSELRSEVHAQASAGQLATIELGLRWDRAAAEFWAEIAQDPPR